MGVRRPPLNAPNVPGKPEPLVGTSQSMPVRSVFQFLGRMRKTGKMMVVLGQETLTFEFADGCIQLAGSDNSPVGERLGELLVERGCITRQAVAPLLAAADSSDEQMGDLAIKHNLASNGQLLETLELQVQRRFARACESNTASYRFEECRMRPGDGRIRITPLELVFDTKRPEG